MCSRRRNAPSVPASLQRSASAINRRFSLPENWRRLAIATTSGSRRAPSPEAISPVALPAPSATASEEEPDNPFREDLKISAMRSCSCPTCTLNCPRQVSHLTLARGAHECTPTPTDNILDKECAILHPVHHNNRGLSTIAFFSASLVDGHHALSNVFAPEEWQHP